MTRHPASQDTVLLSTSSKKAKVGFVVCAYVGSMMCVCVCVYCTCLDKLCMYVYQLK